jgi:hypothetical protein
MIEGFGQDDTLKGKTRRDYDYSLSQAMQKSEFSSQPSAPIGFSV